MHIPDGFLDAKTWVATTVVGAGALSYSLKKVREEFNERLIPVMGVLAAFIFAAQMINFPIAGGTSGHLLGATLATVLLGPWCSGLIISTVLIIQCLFFNDGGLTALGANVLNMAFIGSLVAYGVYKLVSGKSRFEQAAIFLAAWSSVIAAALAATVELALSGTVPFHVALAAMLSWHFLIGIGEGLITVVVVSYVRGVGLKPTWQQKKA
ncbi:Fused nickel transport protein NikMN [Pelotomaculum sp. FP]|uniref:energy-coupling factor ABC transporter permease n=1 Tax=Pelotomaculum sp. FP TaxID=261474 RepID=UPI0010656037|nr:energy-coupling factor ABC transporter permease [Pelotomaculum sp. FP]TEB16363.1 Fused nickel transport protein NikMN [Pelotomaculum sp. FP]